MISHFLFFFFLLLAKCIDEYIRLRVLNNEKKASAEAVTIDARLENVVGRMFERCYADGEYRQAMGIALETRRIDEIRKSILSSGMFSFFVCSSLFALGLSRLRITLHV